MIPSTYFKKLEATEDLWECRVQLGSNAYRFLNFFSKNSVIVLTHGFLKKSQKIPRNEIDLRGDLSSEHGSREGGLHVVLLVDGATRALVIERAEAHKKDFMRRSKS